MSKPSNLSRRDCCGCIHSERSTPFSSVRRCTGPKGIRKPERCIRSTSASDERPSVKASWSEHEADIGAHRRIGERRLLEVVGAEAEADRDGEEIDDLVRVRTQQVRAEDLAGAL